MTEDCEYFPFSSMSPMSSSSSSSASPGVDPQLTWDMASELCKDGLNPRRINGLMLQLIIMHFADAHLIFNPNLQDNVWTKDPKTTKIWITTVSRWDPTGQKIRPAIIVKRKPYDNQRFALDDRYMDAVMDTLPGGHPGFNRKQKGAHQFLCVGRSGIEAEDVAFEVEEYLTTFAPVIKQYYGLDDFQCTGIGELSPLKEDKTNFVVPVMVTYEFQWMWHLVKKGPIWKSTDLNVGD